MTFFTTNLSVSQCRITFIQCVACAKKRRAKLGRDDFSLRIFPYNRRYAKLKFERVLPVFTNIDIFGRDFEKCGEINWRIPLYYIAFGW